MLLQQCITTYDENFIKQGRIDVFDAIYISAESYRADPNAKMISEKFFKNRKQNQIFIMNMVESPRPQTPWPFVNKKYLSENVWNWTFSYRKDSDIHNMHHVYFIPKGQKPHEFWKIQKLQKWDMNSQKLLNRTGMAFWLVSHCHTSNNREGYVRRLQEYIPVEIYGKCNNSTCPKHEDCFKNLSLHHLFYLSFENSLCTEYATEKIFEAIQFPIVPVVMGDSQFYKENLPEKSYIDVNDFESIEDLAKYLIYLQSLPKIANILTQLLTQFLTQILTQLLTQLLTIFFFFYSVFDSTFKSTILLSF